MLRMVAVFVLALSAPLAAQTPPRVAPGGVATMVVTLAPAARPVSYALETPGGVRSFAPPAGRSAAAPGDSVRLPFTFGLPARAPAGPFTVSTLTLEWADGRRDVRDLVVEVLARRGASFSIDRSVVAATPGSPAEVGYRIANEGNAPDTFTVRLGAPAAWAGAGAAVTHVLEPGADTSGALRTEVPHSALPGEQHVLRVSLTATDVREVRSPRVAVVTPDPAVGNLATVPGSLFLGSTTGDGSGLPGVALTAAGEVRPGLRIGLDLRHLNDLSPARVFRSELSGPRLRVGLDGEGWSARAGDVFSLSDLVTGPAIQGRGVEATFEPGSWQADVFLARPWSYIGDVDGGHVVRTAARRTTTHGTFGIRFSSVDREGDLFGGYRQAGGALTYSTRAGGHDLDAELGILHVTGDSASTGGAAAQVRYAFNGGPVSLAARLRRVPGTTARTASHGNEAFVFGSYRLTDIVAITGSAYGTDAPRVDGGPHATGRGATAGLRLSLPRGLNARMTALLRSSEFPGSDLPDTRTRALSLGADVPVGPVVVEAQTQVGTTRGFVDYRSLTARLGARWTDGGNWGWIGLSHHELGAGTGQTALDVSGALRFREAEIQAGLAARLTGADRVRGTSFWSGVTVPVVDRTSLSLGAEFRGYDEGSPWRFSLGLRRSFGMPLPISRKPVLEGLIFEDLDGDGARGPAEPALPGIGVRLGAVRATTDDEGRFRFYDAASEGMRVEASDLPLGVSLADGGELPARGRAEIPVVHTASIEVRAFTDRDGNAQQDAGEAATVGAVVSVVPASGRARDGVTDASGRIRFGGLRPGHYTILIQRADGRGDPVEVPVVLQPGAEQRITVGVPLRSREIRLPNGASLDASFPALPSAQPQPPGSAAPGPSRAPAAALAAAPERPRPIPPAPVSPAADRPASRTGGLTERAARADSATADSTTAAGAGAQPPRANAAGRRLEGDTWSGLLVALLLLTPGIVAAGIYRRKRSRDDWIES